MAFYAGSIYADTKLETKGWKSGLGKIGKMAKVGFAAIGAAAVAGMAKSVKAADSFEKAMANVDSIVDNNVVNTKALAAQLIKLNPALGDTTDLAKGMYQAFSSGASTEKEAMDLTVASAKFAKAALTDTSTSVNVLSTAINAYGKENMSANRASDLFFNSIKLGKLNGEELAASIGKSIPLFASTGIELEELTSGMTALTKVGVSARESTTQLNGIVNAFLKPSEEMSAALERVGYTSGAAFLEAEGLSGALELVKSETDGNKDAFGELFPSIEAMRGAMGLLGDEGASYNKILEEQTAAAGVTEEAFKEQRNVFDTLKNALDKIMVSVGRIGTFFVDKIAGGATKAATAITDFLNSSRGIKIVANIVGFLAGAWSIVKTTFGFLKDKIMPIFIDLWNTLKESLSKIWGTVKDLVGSLFNMTGELSAGEAAANVFSGALNVIMVLFSVLSKVVNIAITYVGNLINIWLNAGKVGVQFFNWLTGKATWDDVKKAGKEVGQAVYQTADDVFTGVGDLWTETKAQVLGIFGDTKDFGDALESGAVDAANRSKQAMQKTLGGKGVSLGIDVSPTGDVDFGDDDTGGKTVTKTGTSDGTSLESAMAAIQSQNDARRAAYKEEMDRLSKERKAKLKAIEEQKKAEIKAAKVAAEKRKKLMMDGINVARDAFKGITSAMEDYYKNEQTKIRLATEEKIAALGEELAAGKITQEEHDAFVDQANKERAAKENEARKKSFTAKKAGAIAEAVIGGAVAIINTWSSYSKMGLAGVILAGIQTAMLAGLTATKIALISSQQFVPSKAIGGMAGGFTRINEEGGEIVKLPDGSQVIPHDLSRDIVRASGDMGGGNVVINISFKGAVIKDTMDLDFVANEVSRKLGKQLRYA